MENKLREMEQSMEERWRKLEARVESIDRSDGVRRTFLTPGSQLGIAWTPTSPGGSAMDVHVGALEACLEAALEALLPHVGALLSELEKRIPKEPSPYASFLPPQPQWPTTQPSTSPTRNGMKATSAQSASVLKTSVLREPILQNRSLNSQAKTLPTPSQIGLTSVSFLDQTTTSSGALASKKTSSAQQAKTTQSSTTAPRQSSSAISAKNELPPATFSVVSSFNPTQTARTTEASTSVQQPTIYPLRTLRHASTTQSPFVLQPSLTLSSTPVSTTESPSSAIAARSSSAETSPAPSSIASLTSNTRTTSSTNPVSDDWSTILKQIASELMLPTQPSAVRNDTPNTLNSNSSPMNSSKHRNNHTEPNASNSSSTSRLSSLSIPSSNHHTASSAASTPVENRTLTSSSIRPHSRPPDSLHPSSSLVPNASQTNPTSTSTSSPKYTVRLTVSDGVQTNPSATFSAAENSSSPSSAAAPVTHRSSASETTPSPADDRMTPLVKAAKDGRLRDVLVALEGGANIDDCDAFGQTALHWAAWYGHHDILALLLRNGADNGHVRNSHTITPLHVAAANGHAQCVAFLVDAAVDLNARSKSLKTPLHLAAFKGHEVVVQILLAAGACAEAVDADGKTPLDLARSSAIQRLLLGVVD